jgi:hypothetical protein
MPNKRAKAASTAKRSIEGRATQVRMPEEVREILEAAAPPGVPRNQKLSRALMFLSEVLVLWKEDADKQGITLYEMLTEPANNE